MLVWWFVVGVGEGGVADDLEGALGLFGGFAAEGDVFLQGGVELLEVGAHLHGGGCGG